MYKAITVSQLNEYVRLTIESDPALTRVYVRGEISGFKYHTSGHMYFTLKDSGAVIRCVMFRQQNYSLGFMPVDGMCVTIAGRVSVYPRDGQYQLYVSTMAKDGQGELFAAFEALKQRLAAEGLFETQRKRPIPSFVNTIGVVTSPTGAVLRDIINISKRRWRGISIILYPVKVQGEGAASEIAKGIKYLSGYDGVDVLIIGRGGGSIEDLWAFNDESVARAIFNSPVPVISAVGHETDFTIADFVADLRAPTPSGAAELAVRDSMELSLRINTQLRRIKNCSETKLIGCNLEYKRLINSPALRRPESIYQLRSQLIDNLDRMTVLSSQRCIEASKQRLAHNAGRLHALSPLEVLARGYAIVNAEQGAVRSIHDISRDEHVNIRFTDGIASARILDTRSDNNA